MSNYLKVTFFAAAVLLGVAVVHSQDFLRADHKINGGRVRSNQRHAQDEALELHHLSQVQRPIPREEYIDFLNTIKKDIAASDKALAKLETESRKVKDASDFLDSIKKHHVKAGEQILIAEKATSGAEADKAAVGNSSSEIYYELEAAQADTQKLLAALKIDGLEAPKKLPLKK